MMAGIKDFGGKIASLRNMQKVTRAMNMISTIKLQRLYSLQQPLKEFSSALDRIVQEIRGAAEAEEHRVLKGYSDKRDAIVVAFSADKGLCGSHNNSVQKALTQHLQQYKKCGVHGKIVSFGQKGTNFCRRQNYEIFYQSQINERALSFSDLKKMAESLYRQFINGDAQEVSLVYNRYINTLQQETQVVQLLPLPVNDPKQTARRIDSTEFEPDIGAFIDSAGELYIYYALCAALYNSYLSEHASRMSAMENATHNSEDLINRYKTLQNRARQSAITNELIEIVSGKEAMKG